MQLYPGQFFWRIVFAVVGVEVEGPLPAHSFTENCPLGLKLPVDRRSANFPTILKLVHEGIPDVIVIALDFKCSLGQEPGVVQVWSLTQFYSVDFSQLRISIKSAFSTNAQSRFASVVVNTDLGTARPAHPERPS